MVKELKNRLNHVIENHKSTDDATAAKIRGNLELIKNELIDEAGTSVVNDIDLNIACDPTKFSTAIGQELSKYLEKLAQKYIDEYNLAVQKKEKLIYGLEKSFSYDLGEIKSQYYNESLADLVRNLSSKERIREFKGRLLQNVDPIFNVPKAPTNPLNYRTHFFAPVKYLFGGVFDTYWFNLSVIWVMTIIMYLTLYFELLRKVIEAMEKLGGKFLIKEKP